MTDTPWRKSSRSDGEATCVEVRRRGRAVEVRDSKDPSGPVLAFPPDAWRAFVGAVKADPQALSA